MYAALSGRPVAYAMSRIVELGTSSIEWTESRQSAFLMRFVKKNKGVLLSDERWSEEHVDVMTTG
ncbi:hypothetical protein E4U53_002531, partial [Claviceps sorghi]